VSVYSDDPGYKNLIFGKWKTFVNGRFINNVVIADEEEGFVVFYATDESGRFLLNEAKTEIIKHTIHGKVEILEASQL